MYFYDETRPQNYPTQYIEEHYGTNLRKWSSRGVKLSAQVCKTQVLLKLAESKQDHPLIFFCMDLVNWDYIAAKYKK